MFFHVQLIDNPNTPEKRQESRSDHWQYFDDHRACFVARGATVSDDETKFLSSVLFVEYDDWKPNHHHVGTDCCGPVSLKFGGKGCRAFRLRPSAEAVLETELYSLSRGGKAKG